MRNEILKLNYCHKALELKKDIEFSYLKLAEMLYNIQLEKLYEPQWSSWLEFCMELRLSKATVSKLMGIYQIFILKYGFEREEVTVVGWTLLAETLPHIKKKSDAIKWLRNASSLSREHLKKEVVEAKTNVKMYECKHKDTYTIRICRDCKEKWQDEDKK
jgi:hypothetical protein